MLGTKNCGCVRVGCVDDPKGFFHQFRFPKPVKSSGVTIPKTKWRLQRVRKSFIIFFIIVHILTSFTQMTGPGDGPRAPLWARRPVCCQGATHDCGRMCLQMDFTKDSAVIISMNCMKRYLCMNPAQRTALREIDDSPCVPVHPVLFTLALPQVLCISPQVDLALLEVPSDAFWDAPPAS